MIFFIALLNVKEAIEHPYLISTCWFDQVDVKTCLKGLHCSTRTVHWMRFCQSCDNVCYIYHPQTHPKSTSISHTCHVDGFGVVSVWGTTWEVPSATWAANILGAWRSFCAVGERPTTSPRKKKRIRKRRRMKLDSDCRPPFLVGHQNKIK